MSTDPPSTSGALRVELSDGICAVVLARPDKHNALSAAMRAELLAVLDWAATAPAVRALTISGEGRSFCAGQDLREARAPDPGPASAIWTRGRDNLAAALAHCPLPTVAVLHGHVLGRGLDLALAADLRIAAEDVSLGFPELRHGMTVGGGGLRRLTRLVGEGRAMEMALCSRAVDGRTALSWGLVNSLHPAAELAGRARALAASLAALPELALYTVKTAVRQAFDGTVADGGWADTALNVLSGNRQHSPG